MQNLGVFFGSRAAEHDVSIISGLQVLENADKSKYNAFPVYVSRAGEWFIGEPLKHIATYKNFDSGMKGLTKVMLPPAPGAKGLYAQKGLFGKLGLVQPLDCALLAFHGLHGEDGTMQGLFELADIPYTSCGVVASAAGMDKIVMKAVFQSMGLPVLPSVWCYRDEWKRDREAVLARTEALGYPLFVKPSQLGSSIGISKATDRASLEKAVEIACSFDWRILIEKGLERPDEINCACVGFGNETKVSLCEQPVSWEEFLTFDQKYLAGSKGKGMENLARKIPAPIPDELTKRVKDYTREIFRTFGCKGVVRVDYMMDRATGELYVCEINTIPGSFAFYLFEPAGLSFRHLVDQLVGYAHEALVQKNDSTFAYDSKILDKALGGTKTSKK
ncbi:MAG TPA: D-alanine--D-alanine ligase family protein [Clostridia bacterium]|nr:D-alanine--D-alanine ligase family protein [Clostridia bacterium]